VGGSNAIDIKQTSLADRNSMVHELKVLAMAWATRDMSLESLYYNLKAYASAANYHHAIRRCYVFMIHHDEMSSWYIILWYHDDMSWWYIMMMNHHDISWWYQHDQVWIASDEPLCQCLYSPVWLGSSDSIGLWSTLNFTLVVPSTQHKVVPSTQQHPATPSTNQHQSALSTLLNWLRPGQ